MRRTDVSELETSGARLTSRLAAAMAATSPASGAESRPFRDGVVAALGPGRYVNRALGVGVEPFTDDELARFETFFAAHGVAASVELSSWASIALLAQLGERGYRPHWFRNVYVRAVDGQPAADDVAVREVDDSLFETWRSMFRAAFEAASDEARRVSDEHTAAAFTVPGSTDLLAFVDGEPAGCGTVQIDGRLAWLGGAATHPAFRGRGVQSALIRHRLRLAAAADCDIAVCTALPAGVSARNVERHGFELAYTQLVVTRP